MRPIAVLLLSLTLMTGACTTPDGRFDAASTLGLAAGLAAVGGLAYLATQSNDQPGYYNGGRGYRGGYGYGYGGRGRYYR